MPEFICSSFDSGFTSTLERHKPTTPVPQKYYGSRLIVCRSDLPRTSRYKLHSLPGHRVEALRQGIVDDMRIEWWAYPPGEVNNAEGA